MEKDNALKKVLANDKPHLPYGFDNRVMRQVWIAAEKKRKRAYFLGLAITSFVSIILAIGGYVVVQYYYPFSIHISMKLTTSSISMLKYSVSTAIIVLFLLMMDFYLRRMVQKRHQ